ncbi:hypothetical protein ACFXPJ_17490, partial [Streptomyces goshikiensis]
TPTRCAAPPRWRGAGRPPRGPPARGGRGRGAGRRAPPPGAPGGAGAPTAGGPEQLALLASGGWLRLRTPYGSIATRRPGRVGGLGALQVRPV